MPQSPEAALKVSDLSIICSEFSNSLDRESHTRRLHPQSGGAGTRPALLGLYFSSAVVAVSAAESLDSGASSLQALSGHCAALVPFLLVFPSL